MKYALSVLAGVVIGASLLLLVVFYNPFSGQRTISPLLVGDQRLVDLSYSPVPAETVALTHNGEETAEPRPASIARLAEPAIQRTRILVARMQGSRGEPAGIGIKFVSDSEESRLLQARVLVDSVWHVYLPKSGSLFIDQEENLWSYLRHIVLPARWSSSDAWRGSWYGITTAGPGELQTARVTGGSGRYRGMKSEAVESISARAYSALQGPVAMTGNLTFTLPAQADN